ncbi:MAG: TauD/TfdA family dioxygenase [Candidatus Pacebacteria bacterium]|nr:TauD/TfdA family dioxygenase [Candidatus Paceibacterota bacterium]
MKKFLCTNINDFPFEIYKDKIHTDGIFVVEFKEKIDILSLVTILGIPHSHNGDGNYVWDIKPEHIESDKSHARSHTYEEFTFHTDCSFEDPVPLYMALYVVQEDRQGGGINKLVDFEKILPALDAGIIETLKKDFPIKIPKEFFKDKELIHKPIIFDNNKIAYRRECIIEDICSPDQIQALDSLDNAIHKSDALMLSLSQNSVLFVDNTRYLHARTMIKDPERHLQRMRFF